MPLTKISTDGVKDDAIDASKLPANSVGASELADNAVDTNAIANNAVTAGKLASGVQTTINNNADNRVITGDGNSNTLNGESGLTYNGSTLGLTGGINATGQINTPNHIQISADNKQFIFGASDDGRIYHDGSNSYFTNATGYLFIQGNDVAIKSAAGSNRIIASGSQVDLFYGTSGKLSTINTGVNINGGIRLGGNNAANELDDYEEGTWTPTLTNVFAAGTSSGRVCVYRKIGQMVFITFDIFASASNMDINTSGDTVIGGLPFTTPANFNTTFQVAIYMNNASGQQMANYVNTGPQIVLHGSSRINNVRHLWGFGCYPAS